MNSLAGGSGCTPGTTDSLPDGEWFGFIVDVSADELRFDLACWFTGDAAAEAAAEDGEESPPPNDYHVRNTNQTVRTLEVGSGAEVDWLENPGDPNTETTSDYVDWHGQWEDPEFQAGYWLIIDDGAVTRVTEQFVP